MYPIRTVRYTSAMRDGRLFHAKGPWIQYLDREAQLRSAK